MKLSPLPKKSPPRSEPHALTRLPLRSKLLLTVALCLSALCSALAVLAILSVVHVGMVEHPDSYGPDLASALISLAWIDSELFALALGLQLASALILLPTTLALLSRSSLRRKAKDALRLSCKVVFALNLGAWIAVPFSEAAGAFVLPTLLFSTGMLAAVSLPALRQMWFYTRWAPVEGGRRRVLIVGGGFAGAYAALTLDKRLGWSRDLEIVLVDRRNYFLFPPLLPSAATGAIEPRQVTYPFRRMFETTAVRFVRGSVRHVDVKDKEVRLALGPDGHESESALGFDYLVLAPGATTQSFGTPGVEEHALCMRELSDAIALRDRIIDCFERAAAVADPVEQKELVRFVVVGAGPTGVEIATETHDLIHHVLLRRYPELAADLPEVVVVQSGDKVLPSFHERLRDEASRQLSRLGVTTLLGRKVKRVGAGGVMLDGEEEIRARTCVWCAGVRPSPLLQACSGVALGAGGRVAVDEALRVPSAPFVFALGDAAAAIDPKTGKPLPPLGQVALQQGVQTGENLARVLRGRAPRPFRYFDYGALVSIGEHSAAVDLMGLKLSGALGWVVWRSLYLGKIAGLSNRLRIVLDWTLDLVIERSFAQLTDHDARVVDGHGEATLPAAVTAPARAAANPARSQAPTATIVSPVSTSWRTP